MSDLFASVNPVEPEETIEITREVPIMQTAFAKKESNIHCKDCKAKIRIIASKEAMFCPFCGREAEKT